MSYRDMQERCRNELEHLAPKRGGASPVFSHVEAFILSRREFDDIPAGDPHLRNAVLYCRQRDLPVSAVLTVRKQMVEQWR